MFTKKMRPVLASILFTTIALVAAPSFAQEAKMAPAAGPQIKLPQTAAEHEARAKTYRDQAVEYRKSAAEHKQMAADYVKQHPDMKGSPKGAWTQKMSKHCQMLQNDFEKLAVDAEKAADFHTLRAKEIQGG